MNVLIPIATAMMLETYPMTIGGEAVRNERTLLARVEDGELMRDHKKRGFRTIGYHFYIRKDGTITQHRKLLEVGGIVALTTAVRLASATRVVWMSMASHATLAPRRRRNVLSNCCTNCINCSRKRRLWDITICLALHQRIALVWMPMMSLGG